MGAISVGWDIGGAHLKAALVADGELRAVGQWPCPLWQTLEHLHRALDQVAQHWPWPLGGARHALTMTGELADIFPDRTTGVVTLVEVMAQRFPADAIRVYAGRQGLQPAARARELVTAIASANWLVSAQYAAHQVQQGVFIDCGSTTTDIIPFRVGQVVSISITDADRLSRDELVYSGVVRTPVCALAQRAPFAGEWQSLAAEVFATTADVYRLLGVLPEGVDQLPSADGRGKSELESAVRLARMLGRDGADASLAAWRQLAGYLAQRQLLLLADALARVVSGQLLVLDVTAPLVGAGVGRFLVRRLAELTGRPYCEFGTLPGIPQHLAVAASDHAPAVALALLAAG